MTWAGAMRAALIATAGRGRWWLAALAGFLVRGGLLVLLPAIVAMPTPAGLALHLDPSLTGDSPGDLTPALAGVALRLTLGAILVLVATTAIGARLEGDLVAAAAQDAELGSSHRPLSLPLGRAVVARLVTHLPTLGAVIAGGLALASVAFGELVSPSGTGSLVARVIHGAPLAVIAILATWLLGEAWGGLAVRRLAAGEGLGRALGGGLVGVVRASGLATLGLSSLVVAAPLLALWLAAARAYDRLWPLIVDRADPLAVAVGLALFVATWGAGLWLLGIGLAFRSAAWTAEALRES